MCVLRSETRGFGIVGEDLIFFMVAVWAAVNLLPAYGLKEAEGSRLRPSTARLFSGLQCTLLVL